MDPSSRAAVERLSIGQAGVVSRQDACSFGLNQDDIRRLLRRGQWRRLYRGTYLVDADVRGGVPRRSWMWAALLAYGPSSCLVGATGLELHGVQGLPVERRLYVGVLPTRSHRPRPPFSIEPSGVDDSPGVLVRQIAIHPDEVTSVDGLTVTVTARALADAGLTLDRTHAMCVLDSALNLGKVTEERVQQLGDDCVGRPGVRRLRELLPLADGRAQSPLETRVRLACIDAGLAPDDLQYVVRDRWGRLLGIADLAWWRCRRRALVAEADGVDAHSAPHALLHDRRRANDFTLAEVDTVRFTWADAVRPAYIASVIRRGLAQHVAA